MVWKTCSVTPRWPSVFYFYLRSLTMSVHCSYFPFFLVDFSLAFCIYFFFSLHFLSLSPPAMCRAFNLPAISLSVSLHLSFQFHHHASIHQTASIFISSFFLSFFCSASHQLHLQALPRVPAFFSFPLFHLSFTLPPTSTSFCTHGRAKNAKSLPRLNGTCWAAHSGWLLCNNFYVGSVHGKRCRR